METKGDTKMNLEENFPYDVDHMPGRVHKKLSDLPGHKESKFTVATNPKDDNEQHSVTVSATSKNHAMNLAATHFNKKGLVNGKHYDGLKVVAESEEQLDELSNDTLASYKKKAGQMASTADKMADAAFANGKMEQGKHWTNLANKKFRQIVKATNKQFDNDKKLREETEQIEELSKQTLNKLGNARFKQAEDSFNDEERENLIKRGNKAINRKDSAVTPSIKSEEIVDENIHQSSKEGPIARGTNKNLGAVKKQMGNKTLVPTIVKMLSKE